MSSNALRDNAQDPMQGVGQESVSSQDPTHNYITGYSSLELSLHIVDPVCDALAVTSLL